MKTREEGLRERERERERGREERTQRDGGEKGGPGGMARESRGGRHLKGRVGWRRGALLSRERSAEQMQSGNPGPEARFRDRGPSTWRSRHRLKVSTAETAKGMAGREGRDRMEGGDRRLRAQKQNRTGELPRLAGCRFLPPARSHGVRQRPRSRGPTYP